jgi:PPE family
MAISVDLDSLAADGAALADWQTPQSPVGCEAPGADSVSVWVAEQLSTLSAALTTLVNHGQQVRTEGGTATQLAAAVMGAADEAGSAVIAGGTSTSDVVSTPITPAVVPDPVLPAIAPMPPPATTTGEAQAKALYGGPGAASLRALADYWQPQAATLDNTAADTGQTAIGIDAHWSSDAGQQAGTNTATHSNFWSVLAEYARGLASAANEAADNYDRAATPTATPTPNEFTAAHAQVTKAIAANNASHGLLSGQVHAATAHLAQLQAQAIATAHAYYTESAATIGSIPGVPAPAKPIAKGGSSGAAPTQSGNSGTATNSGQSATNSGQSAANSGQLGASNSGQSATNSGAVAAGTNATNAATNASAGSSSTGQLAQSVLPALESLPMMGMMGPMAAMSGLGSQSQQNTPGAMAAEAAGFPGAEAMGSGLGADFGDTTPAAGGGGGGGADAAGGAAQALPMATPHGPPPPAVSGPGGTFMAPAEGAATAPAGAGGGGASAYPPMMGAPGGGDHGAARNIRLFPDRRMVWRPVPNTEAVFGELERERRPRSKRATPEEESNEG